MVVRSAKAKAGPHVLTAALAIGACVSPAHAQLTGGSVVAGKAIISQPSATSTLIKQLTPNAIINWGGFSIPRGDSVVFQQLSSSAIALNRVLGGSPSFILGSLSANGRVWLINPAGIVVGSGGSISAAGVLLSTADIHNADFLAGNYSFDIPGNAGAGILNRGAITASGGGTVVLAGAHVTNDGLIAAELGSVVVAGASTYAVDFTGDGLLSFAITSGSAASGALVANKGTISAKGGLVLLTAQTARSVLDNVINTSGIVEATSAANVDGKIVLSASGGGTEVSGTLDASGKGAGQTGGTVEVLGDSVTLAAGAKVDVSGDAGGGTALIGGNFHGAGPEQNAATTSVAAGSIIDADAITSGNGGMVAVWSNGTTTFDGSITARGGEAGGNGGSVETSGQALTIAGTVDASASAGHDGTWLLDPADFTICNVDCTMSPASIIAALSSAEVIVEAMSGNSEVAGGLPVSLGGATGNIVVSDPLLYSSPNQLSLLAEGNITLDATIQNSGTGNVNLIAGWDGVTGVSGSTFAVAALYANPKSYGLNGGSVYVSESSYVVSLGGTTTVAGTIIDPVSMVITDPTDSFEVGVDTSGVLYDSTTGIGFRRISDAYDPLAPGTPQESWGISWTGATSGFAQGDPEDFGNVNETSIASYTANTAMVVNNIGNGTLTLSQFYSFAAPNVLTIQESVTNNTGAPLSVLFQRDIDWDVAPTEFDEVTTIPGGAPAPIIDTTFTGFTDPDPAVAYTNSGYPAGGTQGPSDLGAGIKISVGTLAASASTSFVYDYALSMIGQSEAALGTELAGLGAVFTILTDSSEGSCLTCGSNSAAIAFGSGSSSGSGSNSSPPSSSSNNSGPASSTGQLQSTAASSSAPIIVSSTSFGSSAPSPGTSAPPAASSGPASGPGEGSGSSSGLTSVSDIDTGSSLFSEISGSSGGSSPTDPIANVPPVTPAPQPVPLPLVADAPLGGRGSYLFQASHAPVRADDMAGIDDAPPSSGNEALWFAVAQR